MTLRRRGIPRLRIQTYKSHQQARRSFYKYICKDKLFTNLVNGRRPVMSNPYSTGYYLSGYPLYEASRSCIRNQWERVGNSKLTAVHDAIADKQRTWFLNLLIEEEQRDTELFRLIEGSGVTSFDIYQHLGLQFGDRRTINRDLLEAQAFLLAIKHHIKQQTQNGKRHRTKKCTLHPASLDQGGNHSDSRGNRNDKRSRKGSPLR